VASENFHSYIYSTVSGETPNDVMQDRGCKTLLWVNTCFKQAVFTWMITHKHFIRNTYGKVKITHDVNTIFSKVCKFCQNVRTHLHVNIDNIKS